MIAFPLCPNCYRRYPTPPGQEHVAMSCPDCHVPLVLPTSSADDLDNPGMPYPDAARPAPLPPRAPLPLSPSPLPPPPPRVAPPPTPPKATPRVPPPPPRPKGPKNPRPRSGTPPTPPNSTAPPTKLIWAVRGAAGVIVLALVLYVGGVRLILSTAATPDRPPAGGSVPPSAAQLKVEFAKAAAERPFPIDPRLEQGSGPVDLVDLTPFGIVRGPWPFGQGTHGENGERPIVVKGEAYPRGLSLHPSGHNQPTHVSFALGRVGRRLTGLVALSDDPSESLSPVTFAIFGDGKELWRSPPMLRRDGLWQFDIEISTVNVLTLVTNCPGINYAAHAVWLDPVIAR